MRWDHESEFPCKGNLNAHFEILKRSPSAKYRAWSLKKLGDYYATMDDPAEALGYYRQAAAMAPREPGPYIGLGAVAIQTGQIDEAERAFQAACRLEPRCAEAYGGLAMIRHQQQRYQDAFEMYLKCLELDSDNLIALLGLFQTSRRMGTFAKIIHYLEVYLDAHPDDTAVLFCLATLYARDGRLNRARETLLSLLRIEPDKAEAVELLQKVRSALGGAQAQKSAAI